MHRAAGHVVAIAILLSFMGGSLAACTDQSGASGPDLTSVGFDTSGSGCTTTDVASTFPHGVPIHAVLTMEPALPTGGTVTIKMEKDGTEIVERGGTVTMTEPAPCVYATLTDLEVGHYRMTYTITPSQMLPATGEFDVTP